MKKLLYSLFILLGVCSFIFSIITFIIVSNHFVMDEQYFINGYLGIILVAIDLVSICLITIGSVKLHKLMR